MTRWHRSLTSRRPSSSIPRCRSPSTSSSSASGSTTTPLPITEMPSGQKIPEGTRCSLKVPPGFITVCPALLPPEKRAVTWAFSARTSTILPLPSSPHWPPSTAHTGILSSSYRESGPRRASESIAQGGRPRGLPSRQALLYWRSSTSRFPGHAKFTPYATGPNTSSTLIRNPATFADAIVSPRPAVRSFT